MEEDLKQKRNLEEAQNWMHFSQWNISESCFAALLNQ